MTNLQWCCETNLFATEALAEILGVELPTVEMPRHASRGRSVAVEHLVRQLRPSTTDDEYLRYQLRTMFRLARHVARLDEIGDAVSSADLDDLHRLLGHRPDSWLEGEAELERFVLADADDGPPRRGARSSCSTSGTCGPRCCSVPHGSAMTKHATIQTFAT